jgi:hypothetical protein
LSNNPSRFREHVNVVRDFVVIAAVLVYFLGFVYLYYYFDGFGVSLIALQLEPQHVFAFAYSVLVHSAFATAAFVLVVFALASAYNYAMEKLSYSDETTPHYGTTLWSHVLQRRSRFRWFVMLGAVAAMLLAFPAAFGWAHQVARENGAVVFQAAHEGSRRHLRVVEAQSGPLVRSTPDFRRILRLVNDAGAEGRAIPVGESADRIFILVGAAPGAADNPNGRLPGDEVFAIEKRLIAVEEGV